MVKNSNPGLAACPLDGFDVGMGDGGKEELPSPPETISKGGGVGAVSCTTGGGRDGDWDGDSIGDGASAFRTQSCGSTWRLTKGRRLG